MLPWRRATEQALYGPRGFYRRPEGSAPGPAVHFRTSVHASPLFARAVLAVLERVDSALDRPARLDLVDVGAGRGELLCGLLELAPADLAARLRPVAVEVTDRPDGVDRRIDWRDAVPEQVTGLVVATEWLDNVPVEVAEVDPDGCARLVLVDPADGSERLGPPVDGSDRDWLRRWWPLAAPGDRAEIGSSRDAAWAGVVATVRSGALLAVDYAHDAGFRPPRGSLAGYRHGRLVPPVPDGTCDVTAHVALDAVAVAGEAAGATGTLLTDQRSALRSLGISGVRPEPQLAGSDPAAYIAALMSASEAAELTDSGGLGGHGWLFQEVGVRARLP